MPTYEFLCAKCGNEFAEVISISEYEQRSKKGFRCPRCKSRRLEQKIGRVTVETSKKS